MCVIIVRDPGVTIPQEKLESACIVNPDGWGIAVADRGKLEYQHGLENDPEQLARVLEDAKFHTVLFHLRFITAGEKSLINCHPFKTMTHDADGFDIAFAHNGTLYNFKPKEGETTSDSYNFNQRFVRPLLLRSAALAGNASALDDKFVAQLLEEKVGASKFALLDGNGNSLIINYSDGTEHEGWWSSNTYSFERDHRTGKSSSYGGYSDTYDWEKDGASYEDWQDKMYGKKKDDCNPPFSITDQYGKPTGKVTCGFVPAKKENELQVMPEKYEPSEEEQARMGDVMEQAEDFGVVVKSLNTPRLNQKLVDHLLQRKSPSFTEITKIDSLSEMTRFDPEDLCEMVNFYPDLAAILLQDLLYELYLKDSAIVQQRAEHLAAKKTQEAA